VHRTNNPRHGCGAFDFFCTPLFSFTEVLNPPSKLSIRIFQLHGKQQVGKLTHKADVIVIGVGAFGSAVAWRLAARGMDVIALDQESIPNDKGSSHGQTRIFRALSQNHVDLYPLAMLSKRLWRELQDATKQRLFEASGALIIGENGRGRIANALEVAKRFGIEPQVLSSGELRRQYPAFSNVSDDE